MYSVTPNDIPIKKFYGLLAGSVVPRPIALASTIDKNGNPNLAPFSCFNFFGGNPPTLVLSPMRRFSNGETKGSLHNLEAVKEVVINVVNHDMVYQTSLASTAYEEGVNEFKKAGFEMQEADLVKPFRVAEAPVQFECKVKDIIYIDDTPGAANLVICEVIKIHVDEEVMFAGSKIDQNKLDAVGRMGGGWYTRANMGMFEIPKPTDRTGMGVDQLPGEIKNSTVLTGNDLGRLGNAEVLPQEKEINDFIKSNNLDKFITESSTEDIHLEAQALINKNKVTDAWKLLLADKK